MSQPLRVLVLMLVGIFCMGGLAIAEDAGELVPLDIELPEPFYGGPYVSPWGAALEPESFKDREPFLAPKGTALLSRTKPVTTSAGEPITGKLSQIVDGDKRYEETSLVTLEKGRQWVQVDLEESCPIYAVLVWHFHHGKRIYFDIIVQLAADPEFKEDVTTIYNNDFDNSAGMGVGKDYEYIEKFEGRLIPAEGVKSRYVRLYSHGNTVNDENHYVEVEVFGKPAA